MTHHQLVELAATAFELAGMSVMVLGALVSLVPLRRGWRKPDEVILVYRQRLGRAIVLGLEFLVAADILQTISTEPTLRNVVTLGIIVLIRTFLSFSLEVELEGRWPWQRYRQELSRPLPRDVVKEPI